MSTPTISGAGQPVRRKACDLPLRREMCATCPWRAGSKYAYLLPSLSESALTDATRICHSTGSNNGINRRTGKPPAICRGARDLQLQYFASTGFLKEPTDAAWYARLAEIKGDVEIKPVYSTP